MSARASRTAWLVLAALHIHCAAAKQGDSSGGSGPFMPPPPPPADGPALVVTAPARAAFVAAAGHPTIAVTGTGATTALTINGRAVTPAGDGSFTSTVTPVVGLNLVHVLDGARSVDVPFLYGDFQPAAAPVAQAVALRLNTAGFASADPNAPTLSSLATMALTANDPLAPLSGQTFTGGLALGGSWRFTVIATRHGRLDATLGPRAGGASAQVTIDNIAVDGQLTVSVLGQSPSGPVELTMDQLVASGGVDIAYDDNSRSIRAAMPVVDTAVTNFQYHSNNAGWPCCVDSIMSGVLSPTVAQMVHDQVQANLPANLSLALSSFSLPPSLDLSSVGLPGTIDLALAFDGASFTDTGATITAQGTAHHAFATTDPGSGAPGWLSLGAPTGAFQTAPPVGMAQALDLVNQALFAVWGQGALVGDYPLPGGGGIIHATPRLPPLLLPNAQGGLTIALGEVVLDLTLAGKPVSAAVTLFDDAKVAVNPRGRNILLIPGGNPRVSFTWLKAEGLTETARQAFALLAPQFIATWVQPMEFPLPTLPLDALGRAGAAATLSPTAAPATDAAHGRVTFYGDLALVP